MHCTIENVWGIAQQGDHLNRLAGEVRIAARHIQGINLVRRNDLVKGFGEFIKIDPPMLRQIQGYHSIGVLPVYRVGIPPAPRVRGFPDKKRQSFEILPKLRIEVRDGGDFDLQH